LNSIYCRYLSIVAAAAILAAGVTFAEAKDRKSAAKETMTFKVIDHPPCACVVVFASGEIGDPTIDRFQDVLDTLEKTTDWSRNKVRLGVGPQLILLLDSPGGLVAPAYSVSRQLRLNGAKTAVLRPSASFSSTGALDPSSCESACSIILLGGKTRFSGVLSNIGLHQIHPLVARKRNFTRKDVLGYLSSFEDGAADFARHLEEMDADPELLLFTMQTNQDEMSFINWSKAKSLGIINDTAESLGRIVDYGS